MNRFVFSPDFIKVPIGESHQRESCGDTQVEQSPLRLQEPVPRHELAGGSTMWRYVLKAASCSASVRSLWEMESGYRQQPWVENMFSRRGATPQRCWGGQQNHASSQSGSMRPGCRTGLSLPLRRTGGAITIRLVLGGPRERPGAEPSAIIATPHGKSVDCQQAVRFTSLFLWCTMRLI